MRRYIFLIPTFVLILAGCLKIEEASEIPNIKFKSVTVTQIVDLLDNPTFRVTIALEFEDGDGNVGSQADTVKSLFLDLYKYIDGNDTLSVKDSFNIPYIEPVKTVRTMVGEIKVNHDLLVNNGYNLNDTIYYEIFLKDRANNESNIIKTENIKLKP